jgi:cyclophilin family peptidyl-prolyl cis-trans isomerase
VSLFVALSVLAGCTQNQTKTSPSASKPTETKTTFGTVKMDGESKPPSNPNNPVVLIETSMGPIKIELFEDKAPITVKNMLGYVDEKFYDGTIFHRTIPHFMIQGGGFEPGLKEKPTKETIKNESGNGVRNDRGTIAMARRQDLDSATCQFYINVKDNPDLDKGSYCAFGQVLEGMAVVDKIKSVRTGSKGGHHDVPLEDVVIKSIRRVQ